MEALLQTLLQHFAGGGVAPGDDVTGAAADVAPGAGADRGRAIVFTNLRESVHAIAEVLRRHAPVIQPR